MFEYEEVNVTRSQSAAPALAGQCLDARDLVVLSDAGTHRGGLAVVRAVEVAAAGEDVYKRQPTKVGRSSTLAMSSATFRLTPPCTCSMRPEIGRAHV